MSFIINYICAYTLYTPYSLYYKWNQIIFVEMQLSGWMMTMLATHQFTQRSSSDNPFSIAISGILHKSNESGL